MSGTLSDKDVENLIQPDTPATKLTAGAANTIVPATTRKLLVVGCGDGGCNIASQIGKELGQEAYVIAYNTSTRAMDDLNAAIKILPGGEDGSGKVRDYSKTIFKSKVYKDVLASAAGAIEKKGPFSYILVCTTTDGGTGSGISPMAAKLLADNTGLPVLVVGVYPNISEDATAQYNGLQWQSEIAKIGVNYFVLDNDQPGMATTEIHRVINNDATRIASLIAGKEFGNTNISMIDDRNLYMLLQHVGQGGRSVAAISTSRMQTGQTLDAYVEDMLQKCHQPLPKNMRGLGVFVKATAEQLDKLDVKLPEIQAKYGNAVLHFAHLEESDEFKVAVLMTGCSEASGRLTSMKNRYDDIMSSQVAEQSVLGSIMDGTENPMGKVPGKAILKEEPDISALDL